MIEQKICILTFRIVTGLVVGGSAVATHRTDPDIPGPNFNCKTFRPSQDVPQM